MLTRRAKVYSSSDSVV